MAVIEKTEKVYLGNTNFIKQIQGTKDAFIVKDDIEYAYMNIIPLWAFGLNY